MPRKSKKKQKWIGFLLVLLLESVSELLIITSSVWFGLSFFIKGIMGVFNGIAIAFIVIVGVSIRLICEFIKKSLDYKK